MQEPRPLEPVATIRCRVLAHKLGEYSAGQIVDLPVSEVRRLSPLGADGARIYEVVIPRDEELRRQEQQAVEDQEAARGRAAFVADQAWRALEKRSAEIMGTGVSLAGLTARARALLPQFENAEQHHKSALAELQAAERDHTRASKNAEVARARVAAAESAQRSATVAADEAIHRGADVDQALTLRTHAIGTRDLAEAARHTAESFEQIAATAKQRIATATTRAEQTARRVATRRAVEIRIALLEAAGRVVQQIRQSGLGDLVAECQQAALQSDLGKLQREPPGLTIDGRRYDFLSGTIVRALAASLLLSPSSTDGSP